MSKSFDPQWVIDAKQGNQQATTELYTCAWQEVSIVIRSMIRTDEATIQDLVQDTFVKAFQRLDQLGDPTKYHAWVKQIARNTTLDHLKKSKAILFSELSDDDSILVEFEDEDLSHLPEVAVDKRESARLLHEILDSLPEMQRTVISMYYLQEMPIMEIASLLDRSENTIKVQLHKSRKNLAHKIREMERKENIKLYTLSPLAFLLLLLHNAETMPAQPDMALLGDILQTSTASGAAGTAAAGSAARAADGFTIKKIVAGILAAVTLTSGAAVYSSITSQPEYPEKDLFTEDFRVEFMGENGEGTANVYSLNGYGLDSTVEPSKRLSNGDTVMLTLSAPDGDGLADYCEEHYGFTPVSDEKEYTVIDLPEAPEPKYDYSSILADYSAVIRREISYDQAHMDLSTFAYTTTPAGSYMDENGYFVAGKDAKYSFVEYDINGDEIMELLLLEEPSFAENGWEPMILDIFTFYNGVPVWLIAGEYRGTVDLCENGIIRMIRSGGAEAHAYCFYEILDGRLVLCDLAEENWDTYMLNGTVCTEDQYQCTINSYAEIEALAFRLVTTVEPQAAE